MAYLLDTNVLLRWLRPADAHHAAALKAITTLLQNGEELFVAPQSITEFWNVATRSTTRNGYGLSAAQVEPQVQRIERAFLLATETPDVYADWRRIVRAYGIIGIHVFDTRLVAVMKAHGIENILTFNRADFIDFEADEGITVVDPTTV
jgi:predicted nucleic acid-binding protein